MVCYIEVCYIEVPLYREHEVKNRNRKWSQETKNSKQMSRTENSNCNQGSEKKNRILACPLGKKLSHFTGLKPLLAHFS